MRLGDILATLGYEPDAQVVDAQNQKAKRAFAEYLRANQTPSERMMARVLYYLGCDVEPQVPLFGWVVDFLDAEKRIVIEVDGSVHDHQREADAYRDQRMTDEGYRVIRIAAWEVPHMLQQIAMWRAAA